MTARKSVYFDYQATTPVDPRVLDRMLPFFSTHFGNAASTEHRFGWEAEEAVKQARETVAGHIGARAPEEIVFTSGATESNNLAILGAARAYRRKGNHLVTVVTEHAAVLDPCGAWEREGGRVTRLAVEPDGLLDLDRMRAAITPETVLISVMAANNEIGVLQDMAAIGALAAEKGVLFHSDATQAVGKVALDVEALGIHLLSLSAHKIYGPKGMGALYVRARNPRVRPAPLLFGGGHERGLRSGTLNVPGAVGLAQALSLCAEEREDEAARLSRLRQRFWDGLRTELGDVYLNGHETRRLPGNLNIAFAGVMADKLLLALHDLAVSSRSACTSASAEPSHVIAALGLPESLAEGCLRFGFGRFTTEADIEYGRGRVVEEVRRLRQTQKALAG